MCRRVYTNKRISSLTFPLRGEAAFRFYIRATLQTFSPTNYSVLHLGSIYIYIALPATPIFLQFANNGFQVRIHVWPPGRHCAHLGCGRRVIRQVHASSWHGQVQSAKVPALLQSGVQMPTKVSPILSCRLRRLQTRLQ